MKYIFEMCCQAVAVPNFHAAWEAAEPDSEMADDYGLGSYENLQARLSFKAYNSSDNKLIKSTFEEKLAASPC